MAHPLHHVGANHRRKRKDGTHGDIDSTGDDDERLPHRHDGINRHISGNLTDQVVEVEKGICPAVRVVMTVAGENNPQDEDHKKKPGLLHPRKADTGSLMERQDFRRRWVRRHSCP